MMFAPFGSPFLRRCRLPLAALFVVAGFAFAPAARAELRSFDLFLGAPANLPTQLVIEQTGLPDIDVTAEYDSHPFESPIYYAFRFDLDINELRWEIQFIHQKIELSNPPPEVQHFEISHGLNILTLNYASTSLPVTLRIGGGLVLAHAESTVRGIKRAGGSDFLGTEYRLTGPALIAGAGKDVEVSDHLTLIPEVAFSAARVSVPIAAGTATTWNVAFHVLVGIGYRF